MVSKRILLVDNGSYEPAATLALRGLAKSVSTLIGETVHPVSTMHSSKIDPALLGGVPATIFAEAVRQAKADGIDELILLPLFIGPSLAITEYLPKVFTEAQPGALSLIVQPTLFDPVERELRDMLIDNLKHTGWSKGSGTVLLCDHGSPIKQVTACRNALAAAIRAELKLADDALVACSMERREGPEYDFNEPLLEHALQSAKGEVVILMLFLLPGRHAGTDGDVATIAKEHAPEGVRWKISPLLGTHPALPSLLKSRLTKAKRSKVDVLVILGAAFVSNVLPMAVIPRLPESYRTVDFAIGSYLGFVVFAVAMIVLYFKFKYRKKTA